MIRFPKSCVAGAAAALLAFATAGASEFDSAIGDAAPIVQDAYVFLHENPELGKQEFTAQKYLREKLTAIGFTQFVDSAEAPTAVIAILDSGRSGPTIALRSEMDARSLGAVSEPTSHQPRSKIEGLMHNCGHDVHAAILLGTASILIHNKDRISGKIIFLFQPAEETAGGADDIVHEGILTKLGAKAIFAEHVAPGMPVGTVGISSGYTLAGSSYFHLKLKGKGSHAAAPFEGTDTPIAAARIAQQLAEFPARHLDVANRPMVVSVARLLADGGKADNALPADAEMSGTVRAFEDIENGPTGEPSLKQLLADAVSRMAQAYGLQYEWTHRAGAPPTLNHPDLFAEITPALKQKWSGTLDMRPYRGMFSEDFAYYTATMPALYFSLGIAKDDRGLAGVHTAEFDVHPDAFSQGLRVMTMLAIIGTRGTMDW